MNVICAWCGATISTTADTDTHGICPTCYAAFVESAGLLPQIARRLLEARARTNKPDFEKALAEMAAAIRTMDGAGDPAKGGDDDERI